MPVVAFAVAAPAEHVRDGVSGRLVAPGDEPAFIEAAAGLALPPAQLAPLRSAAVEAAGRASWSDILGGFEAHLQDTVDAHQATSGRIALAA